MVGSDAAGRLARSYHPIGGPPAADAEAARERRAAITELGDALRALVTQATATEAPAEELRRVAALVRQATIVLGGRTRGHTELPSADDLLGGIRMYNPVTGPGSPVAPPLRIDLADGIVVGSCTLGPAYEGPPMYAHGGISALLLDQMLGHATSAAGHPGMTVQLDTTYRAPVPLLTALRLTAEVTHATGRRIVARGTIATAAEPAAALVEATGTFVALLPEQAGRLFGPVLDSGATSAAVAHD